MYTKGKVIVAFGAMYAFTDGERHVRPIVACDEYIYTRDERDANMRRIAALWNMADELNLSTEAIEAGVVQDMVATLKALQPMLREVGRDYDIDETYAETIVAEAIAKIKE